MRVDRLTQTSCRHIETGAADYEMAFEGPHLVRHPSIIAISDARSLGIDPAESPFLAREKLRRARNRIASTAVGSGLSALRAVKVRFPLAPRAGLRPRLHVSNSDWVHNQGIPLGAAPSTTINRPTVHSMLTHSLAPGAIRSAPD